MAKAAVRIIRWGEDLSIGTGNIFTGTVPGYGEARWNLAVCVDETVDDLDGTEKLVRKMSPEEWLSTTEETASLYMGNLAIPAEAYYSGLLVRQMEVCRQSLIYTNKGKFVAGFLGSNVNDHPHVWMRDNFYSALAMAWFAPKLLRRRLQVFRRARRAKQGVGAWRGSLYANAHVDALRWQLPGSGGAGGGLPQGNGGRRVAPSGQQPLRPRCQALRRPSRSERAPKIERRRVIPTATLEAIGTRGPIFLSGAAPMDMGDMAELVLDDNEAADRWRVRRRRGGTCGGSHQVRGGRPDGRRFYEGVDRDGTFIAGHDGEESDLTLASYYGFTGPDDPLVTRHARAAFSEENPMYWAPIDGVQWWDPPGKCWGPTFFQPMSTVSPA